MIQSLQSIALCLVYFLVGLICWGLALWRTRACIAGARLLVSGIVLAEELLGLVVIYLLVADKNMPGAFAYALGGAIGAWLAMRPNKEEKK